MSITNLFTNKDLDTLKQSKEKALEAVKARENLPLNDAGTDKAEYFFNKGCGVYTRSRLAPSSLAKNKLQEVHSVHLIYDSGSTDITVYRDLEASEAKKMAFNLKSTLGLEQISSAPFVSMDLDHFTDTRHEKALFFAYSADGQSRVMCVPCNTEEEAVDLVQKAQDILSRANKPSYKYGEKAKIIPFGQDQCNITLD